MFMKPNKGTGYLPETVIFNPYNVAPRCRTQSSDNLNYKFCNIKHS